MRAHFTTASVLAVSVFEPSDEIPEAYQDSEDEVRTTLRLVIEDGGNQEAFVIDGTLGDLVRLARDIEQRTTNS